LGLGSDSLTDFSAELCIYKTKSMNEQIKIQAQSTSSPPAQANFIQRKKADNAGHIDLPAIVYEVLNSPGQPLDPATRAYMEPRFGHDFSKVRVHTDAKAAESARGVNALAYTVGKDVVFGAGQFAPRMRGGQRLLAHELTHVVQQSKQNSKLNDLEISLQGGILEQSADFTANVLYSDVGLHFTQVASKQLVQRSPEQGSAAKSEEKQTTLRRFGGPTGDPIDPGTARQLIRAKYIQTVPGAGPLWPKGYPLIPGVYDGFMNFTFVASSYISVIVERDSQYLDIPLASIAAYARLTPIEKGVWSARWAAVVYPWLIKKAGDVAMASRIFVLMGPPLHRIGEEGLKEAEKSGIKEASEFLEREEGPDIIAAISSVKRCNLDANALIDLEHHRGATAQEIGIRGKLFTTEAARKEFSAKGDWLKLQRKFNIEVLRKGPTYQHWIKEAMKQGLKGMDAEVLAGSRANNIPLVTADPHFSKAAERFGVQVRRFRPYIPRPGGPRRLEVPKAKFTKVR
jgi:hypothetical protein